MQDQKSKRSFLLMPPMRELSHEEARRDPYPILRDLRDTTPVRFDEERKVWDVFLYDDCVRVLKDQHTFAPGYGMTNTPENESLMSAAPPRHREIRSMVEKAFTPKAVNALEPRYRDIAHELLDQVIEQGRMHTFRDFSGPLPVIVIAELLGVPAKDRLKFKEWSNNLLHGVYGDSEEEFQAAQQKQMQARTDLHAYFQGVLNERQAEPQEDLITALWRHNREENILSEPSLVNFCIGLLAAGNETTTTLITNGVQLLTQRPDLQAALAADRSLIPAFVEETLRYCPPSTMIPRVAAVDVELNGQPIKAGDTLHVWLMSANRDERKFPHADEFRLDRGANPHISFGFGIHFCLGAPLARLEALIAFEALFDRVQDLCLEEGAKLELMPFPMFASVKEYPVRFEKRK